jgi:hypothetical protein
MSRLEIKKVAWLCLSAFLSLQVAVAAYACPTTANGHTATSAAIVPTAHPCPGMDQERPKLCEQHCVHNSQTVDTQPHSNIVAPILPLFAVVVQPDFHLPKSASVYGALLVDVVDPPPLIRFGVLRI